MEKLSMEQLGRISVEEYKNSKKTPAVVVLDNVRSALNVGSVFRTSDAFRIEKILLCGITATPPNAEIRKTAIGAEQSVDYQYFKTTVEAVKTLKDSGYTIIAVEQAKESVMIENLDLSGIEKAALVFGNEVKGVDDNVMEMCDLCVEIPQFGTKHSLNISVSAGIVIWEVFRQLKDR
ncbi:MAG: RNA methyltransferase [Bacteroidales bacterium]|jgi:tRNA G18 (ribose-2'-O)-methylase SpoU|nr:RNA methyltransferase [Bacteroidales bacterium]